MDQRVLPHQTYMLKFQHPVFQNEIGFGDSLYKEVIKLNEDTRMGPSAI